MYIYIYIHIIIYIYIISPDIFMDDPLLQSPSRVLFFSSSAVCRCMSSALAGYGMILLISRKKLSLRFFCREKP